MPALKIVDSGINVAPVETPLAIALRFAREQGRVEGAVETARLSAFEQFGRDIAAGNLKANHAADFWRAFAEGRNERNVTKKPLPTEGRKADSYVSKLRAFASPSVLAGGDVWRNAVNEAYAFTPKDARRAPFDAIYAAHCMLIQRCRDESADTDEKRVAVMESISPTAISNAVSKDKGEEAAVHEKLLQVQALLGKLVEPGEKATDHVGECERVARVPYGTYRDRVEAMFSAMKALTADIGEAISE